MPIDDAVGGCEILPSGVIITYARCEGCVWGSHFEMPTWHSWADIDDIEHAELTGQDVAAIKASRCACECARAPRDLTPTEQATVNRFGIFNEAG